MSYETKITTKLEPHGRITGGDMKLGQLYIVVRNSTGSAVGKPAIKCCGGTVLYLDGLGSYDRPEHVYEVRELYSGESVTFMRDTK